MIEGTLLLAGLDLGGLDRDDLLRRNVVLVFDGLSLVGIPTRRTSSLLAHAAILGELVAIGQ
jgi:hypothetical protein